MSTMSENRTPLMLRAVPVCWGRSPARLTGRPNTERVPLKKFVVGFRAFPSRVGSGALRALKARESPSPPSSPS